MLRDHQMFMMTFLFITLILTSCTGGGTNTSSGATFISAELDSFPTGSVPPGFNNGEASVSVVASSGFSITNATVTINGLTLLYDSATQQYEGTVAVLPGDPINLSVTVNGKIYTASATQFNSYPIISSPAPNDVWSTTGSNTVMWSAGTPTTDSVYGLGVLDANNPSGKLIWPADNFLQEISGGAAFYSYSLPANSLTVGNRYVVLGIATMVPISGAADGSGIVVVGLNFVPVRVVEPSTLAEGLTNPFSIAIDSTNIYWVETWGGTVKKVGLNGGMVTTLAAGQSQPSGIAVDSTSVYWAEYSNGTIKKTGLNGGTVTTLVSGLNSPHGIAIDSTSVYWIEFGSATVSDGTVKKIPLTGGAVTTLASGLNGPWSIAVDSSDVYWAEYNGGTIKKVGLNGGTVTTLASGLKGPWNIVVDSSSVYWVDDFTMTVQKVGLNGGTVTTLASGLDYPWNLTVDSTYVYWTEQNSGKISKVGLNGGLVNTLATGQLSPYGVAVDSTSIYWSEYYGGTVKKETK